MTTPQFSILVPTRDRAQTLRYALETLVGQAGSYEVVIADNCSGPAVKMVAVDLASRLPNVKYVRSDSIVPMADNWERGLAQCQGEYVTVLGDDDGLVPSALECALKLIAATKAEVISWAVHTYWWPDTIVYWNANRLFVSNSKNVAAWQESRATLKGFYDGALDFGALPMIYNAFVHRNLIDRVISARGRYFDPVKMSPDVSSGILNLLHADRFVHTDRALALRGNSRHSTGTATWARHLGSDRREAYFREQKTTIEELSDPMLIASPNLHIAIANTKLLCKAAYFENDRELVVDPVKVLTDLVDGLNFEPEAYDDNLADANRLAAKLGIDIGARVPERRHIDRRFMQGPFGSAAGNSGICVNCDVAGIYTVSGAARLADSMAPSAAAFLAG